jgi:hypothetical protein
LDTGVTPAKAWPLWQLVQPPTIPVCFISVPENVVKLLNEWQVSHVILVGKWFTGLDFGVTPVNTCPLWHSAQLLRMPVWVITPEPGPNPALWQVEHTCVVGKCPGGGVVKFAIKNVVVEVWQPEQSSAVVICVVGASALLFGFNPTAKVAPLWQLVQPLTMPAWFIRVPANPPTLVLLAEWQISQGILVGMCGVEPVGLDIGVIPTEKVAPLWQLAQPLTMPEWFIVPGIKLVWL